MTCFESNRHDIINGQSYNKPGTAKDYRHIPQAYNDYRIAQITLNGTETNFKTISCATAQRLSHKRNGQRETLYMATKTRMK
jgi:hypothetical protein